jgi:hypothetical protein
VRGRRHSSVIESANASPARRITPRNLDTLKLDGLKPSSFHRIQIC